MPRTFIAAAVFVAIALATLSGQGPASTTGSGPPIALVADRVFDGQTMQTGWVVVVRGQRIESAGPASAITVPAGARRVTLAGATLMPGLIEGHSHLLLH